MIITQRENRKILQKNINKQINTLFSTNKIQLYIFVEESK